MLTKPFLNNVTDFDGTIGIPLEVGVSGGDRITQILLTVATNVSTPVPIFTDKIFTVSNDTANTATRYFSIPSSYMTPLLNNDNYIISVKTKNASETSLVSSVKTANTYATPSFNIGLTPSSNNIVTSSTVSVLLTFNKNDPSSIAQLNTAKISLYGTLRVGGTEVLIKETKPIYQNFPAQVFTDFALTNATSIYSKYRIVASGVTIGQLKFETILDNITSVYTPPQYINTLNVVNNCEVGTITVEGVINSGGFPTGGTLTLKRREVGSTNYINLYVFNTALTNFTFTDYFGQTDVMYEYSLIPTTSGGVVGVGSFAEVGSFFNLTYIVDQSNSFNITAELTGSGQSNRIVGAEFVTLGNAYPKIGYNAVAKGKTWGMSMTPLTATSLSQSQPDPTSQRILTDKFTDWLSNQKTKIFKDQNGKLIVCNIVQSVENAFFKEFANALATTQYTLTEVGEVTQKEMFDFGMLNNMDIIIN